MYDCRPGDAEYSSSSVGGEYYSFMAKVLQLIMWLRGFVALLEPCRLNSLIGRLNCLVVISRFCSGHVL